MSGWLKSVVKSTFGGESEEPPPRKSPRSPALVGKPAQPATKPTSPRSEAVPILNLRKNNGGNESEASEEGGLVHSAPSESRPRANTPPPQGRARAYTPPAQRSPRYMEEGVTEEERKKKRLQEAAENARIRKATRTKLEPMDKESKLTAAAEKARAVKRERARTRSEQSLIEEGGDSSRIEEVFSLFEDDTDEEELESTRRALEELEEGLEEKKRDSEKKLQQKEEESKRRQAELRERLLLKRKDLDRRAEEEQLRRSRHEEEEEVRRKKEVVKNEEVDEEAKRKEEDEQLEACTDENKRKAMQRKIDVDRSLREKARALALKKKQLQDLKAKRAGVAPPVVLSAAEIEEQRMSRMKEEEERRSQFMKEQEEAKRLLEEERLRLEEEQRVTREKLEEERRQYQLQMEEERRKIEAEKAALLELIKQKEEHERKRKEEEEEMHRKKLEEEAKAEEAQRLLEEEEIRKEEEALIQEEHEQLEKEEKELDRQIQEEAKRQLAEEEAEIERQIAEEERELEEELAKRRNEKKAQEGGGEGEMKNEDNDDGEAGVVLPRKSILDEEVDDQEELELEKAIQKTKTRTREIIDTEKRPSRAAQAVARAKAMAAEANRRAKGEFLDESKIVSPRSTAEREEVPISSSPPTRSSMSPPSTKKSEQPAKLKTPPPQRMRGRTTSAVTAIRAKSPTRGKSSDSVGGGSGIKSPNMSRRNANRDDGGGDTSPRIKSPNLSRRKDLSDLKAPPMVPSPLMGKKGSDLKRSGNHSGTNSPMIGKKGSSSVLRKEPSKPPKQGVSSLGKKTGAAVRPASPPPAGGVAALKSSSGELKTLSRRTNSAGARDLVRPQRTVASKVSQEEKAANRLSREEKKARRQSRRLGIIPAPELPQKSEKPALSPRPRAQLPPTTAATASAPTQLSPRSRSATARGALVRPVSPPGGSPVKPNERAKVPSNLSDVAARARSRSRAPQFAVKKDSSGSLPSSASPPRPVGLKASSPAAVTLPSANTPSAAPTAEEEDDIEKLLNEAKAMESKLKEEAEQRDKELKEAEEKARAAKEKAEKLQEEERKRKEKEEEEAVFAALMAGVQGIAEEGEKQAEEEAEAAKKKADEEMKRLLEEAEKQAEEHKKLLQEQEESARRAQEAKDRLARQEEKARLREEERKRKAELKEKASKTFVQCRVCPKISLLSCGFCGECGSSLEGCTEVEDPNQNKSEGDGDAQSQKEAKKQQKREKMVTDLENIFSSFEKGLVRQTLEKFDWDLSKTTDELMNIQRAIEKQLREEEAERKARELEEKTPTRAKAHFDYEATDANELTIHEGEMITILRTDPSGWWLGELKGKKGLFPENYCKILYGDDEDSSYDSDEDGSLSWDSEEEEGEAAIEMFQECKVCGLAQDASLLCQQCGCSLADCPMVRKDEFLRSNLLSSIRNASMAQLKKVKRKSKKVDSPLTSFKSALEKTRMANAGGEEEDSDDSAWDD